LKCSGIENTKLFKSSLNQKDFLPEALDFLEKSIYKNYFANNKLILSEDEELEWLEFEVQRKSLSISYQNLYAIP
jgi:hypothetical protein